MTVERICPDKVFGKGCDFALVSSDDYAQLFEVKSCRLGQSDATRAAKELEETRANLKTKNLVRPSCTFSKWLIHEKKGTCRTDVTAMVILEKAKIRLANSNDTGFSEIYREWVRLCK